MKQIRNYFTNLALISIIILTGGFFSCSDDDNDDKKLPDENADKELVNQIRYNSDVTDIKSVVWERNSKGAYSVYLSPKESINSIEDLGSDFMKIEAVNISDFSSQTDTYRLAYRDIDVCNESVSDGKASVKFDFKLDLKAAKCNINGSIKVNDSQNSLCIKYDGTARRLMPEVAENQVNYNGEKFTLKSSAWKRNPDGLYTFFISQDEEINTENTGGNLITIETSNPLNFDISRDAFCIKYGSIVLNEKSIGEGYGKVDLKIGFDPVTSTFAVSSEAHSEKGDIFVASYSGSTVHIRPEAVSNKIGLNNEFTDIRSVLWETAKDGSYNIYLSPRKGLETYEDIVKVNDYMLFKSTKADGVINDNYEISFKSIKLNKESNYIDSEISVMLNDGKLEMNIYALTNEGVELNAAYNGDAVKIRPTDLYNQWQKDREEVKTISSVIEWRTGDLVSFYLCNKKGIDTPDDIKGSENIRIIVPKGYSEVTDLSRDRQVKVIYGDIESDKAKVVNGSLRISKNDLRKSVKIELDAVIDGCHLRANWTGRYSVGYDSCNKLRIETPDKKVSEVILSSVFLNSNGVTNSIAFGTKENPKEVNDLMEGLAVQLNLTNLIQDTDLEKTNDYRIRLFDYTTFNTYDSADSKTKGVLKVWNDGNGKLYLMLDAQMNDAKIKAEWYGKVTLVKDFDISPVKPFHPNFKITDKDGKVIKDVEITELQVRNVPNFKSNITGAEFNAYVFYFVNKYSELSGIDDIAATPVLAVSKDYINGEDIDISKGEKIFDFQYLPFNSPGIASPVNGGGTTEKGFVNVTRERENWKIKFSVYDFGDWWGHGTPTGTKATFTAEWEGKGSDYSGKN